MSYYGFVHDLDNITSPENISLVVNCEVGSFIKIYYLLTLASFIYIVDLLTLASLRVIY